MPNLVRAWHYRDPLTLELELRDDAAFHNGDNGWILPQTFSVSP